MTLSGARSKFDVDRFIEGGSLETPIDHSR
jgi:hypothetical protein